MNNKSFYALVSFVAILYLLPMQSSLLLTTIRVILCGSSAYYLSHSIMESKRVSLMVILMGGIVVLFNPFLVPNLPVTAWIPVKIVAAILFYLASRGEKIITKEPRDKE